MCGFQRLASSGIDAPVQIVVFRVVVQEICSVAINQFLEMLVFSFFHGPNVFKIP